LWYLQHCSFCSEVVWLFEAFCASILTLEFIINLSEECHWNFDGYSIKYVDCLANSIHIFTILILPIHDHGIFFHVLMSFSISFFTYLYFSL
jgi:hypothetical protein